MLNRFITVIIIFPFISSCTSLNVNKIDNYFNETKDQSKIKEKEDNYHLGPDDVIRIIVENHPEWSGEFRIKPDGNILIAGLEEIFAEGLTKTMLEQNLSSYLSRYIIEPKVTIEIVRYASQVIYVLGEVNRPNRFPTEGKQLTLRDAIILAGLPTRFAATRTVFIISPSRKKTTRKVVNLYRILYRGELKYDVELQPGDIVYVPKNIMGHLNSILEVILSPLTTGRAGYLSATTPLP